MLTYIPISHWIPSYPVLQVHVYSLIPSSHAAPFWHGFDLHSSVSETEYYRETLDVT